MMLEEITDGIKNRETARFNYSGKVSIAPNQTEPCFSGRMDILTTTCISLGYNPKYVKESEDLADIVEKPFESAFSALTGHELNHKGGRNFRGCPRNIDLHAENILEPVAETLFSLGFPDVPVIIDQTLYAYFANMVADVFDNAELGTKSDHTGMFLVYKDVAEHLPDKKFTLLYDAFVMFQQRLYGGKRANKLMVKHHSGDEKVKEAVDNVMKRAGFDKYVLAKTTRRRKQQIEVFDRRQAINYCLDERNWPQLSRIITEEFSKLLDKSKMSQPDYLKIIFIPLKGEADGFDDEMRDPELRMRFAYRKYQQQGSSFQPQRYLDCFEALDLVYQRLARNLEIKTQASTRSEAMPVMWYGRRPFDERTDRISRARIGINSDGKLELRVKRDHEDDCVEYTESKQNIPEIRFVMLDTSYSMRKSAGSGNSGKIMNPWAKEENQWDDNSKYHHALIGWYGLLEFLKKQGTLRHSSVRFANYSNDTYTADNLRDAKRLALSPQFRNTYLDMEKLKSIFGNKQLVFSLSDGGIANWDNWLVEPEIDEDGNVQKEGITVKDEYIKRAKQNEYFHLQIGDFTKDAKGNIANKPQMCIDLENAGLPVIYDDGRQLGKIIIDLTRPYVTRGKK